MFLCRILIGSHSHLQLLWLAKCNYFFLIYAKVRKTSLRLKASSTLIRFQTKTELFCSVFKKICVHTYRFHIVFARLHYNAISVLKTLLYPQCACSKWTRRMRISIYRPAKLARNWSHMVASVRHFGYSRSSGLAPGHDVTVSPSTLENSVFKKHRFQIAPLWWLRFRWSFPAL